MNKEQAIQKFKGKIDWAKQNRYPYVSESDVELYKMAINALAITPQPKTGHWKKVSYKRGRIGWDNIIEDDYYFECSECKGWSEKDFNYCHWCGARMVEPQESEDNV